MKGVPDVSNPFPIHLATVRRTRLGRFLVAGRSHAARTVAVISGSRRSFRTPDLRGRHFCRFLVDDGEFEPEVRAGETGLKLVQLVTEAVDGAGSMC